jgi:indole-3-glycerol phosphate synthase
MACLENEQAVELERLAHILGMDVLVETHTEEEIERCLTYLSSDLIGINNRNLHDFKTDLSLSKQLSSLIPVDKLVVAESGINSHDDIRTLQEFGINSFLVGESLMRQNNIEAATKMLIG